MDNSRIPETHSKCFSTPENNPIYYPSRCRDRILRPIYEKMYTPRDNLAWYLNSENIVCIDRHIPSEDVVNKPYQHSPNISDIDFTRPDTRSCLTRYFYMQNRIKYPLNPTGITGIKGKGLLNRWGVNHKVELIIARFIRLPFGNLFCDSNPKLEIIVMKNADKTKWLLPGVFEQHERVLDQALKDSFVETICKNVRASATQAKEKLQRLIDQNSKLIFKGYLDDPRNTDNAWIESSIYLAFAEEEEFDIEFNQKSKFFWMPLTECQDLYADYKNVLNMVATKLGASELEVFSSIKLARMAAIASKPLIHDACRSNDASSLVSYCVGQKESPIVRPVVPKDKVNWNVDFPEYKPILYTAPIVLSNPPWADPFKPNGKLAWNSVDRNIDRRSHLGVYEVVNGLPRNPVGRTGIEGRGLLGKWGPNHAADPIVTRWKLNKDGQVERDPGSLKPILQFVAIERIDTKEWAIPGGMCDPGEKVSVTLKREFMEEALNSTRMGYSEREEYHKKLSELFSKGIEIYRGYVDDPRNTDNAWMETIAFNFHDDKNLFRSIELIAGDDAGRAKWMDINSKLKLYASHAKFIHQVALLHKANW